MFKKLIDFFKKKFGRDDTNTGDALREAQESGELAGGEENINLENMLRQGNNMNDLPDGGVDGREKQPDGQPKPQGDLSGFDVPEADASMSQGEKGMIYGLKRKLVVGVVVFIAFLVGSALVYNTSKSTEPQKQEKPTSSQQIAGAKSINSSDSADKLSDDYGELERANAEKLKKNGSGSQPANVQAQKTASANTAPASSTVRPSSSQELPAVPRSTVVAASPVVPPSYSQPYSLPSQQAAAPAAQQPAQAAEKSGIEKIKDSLASAIGFSVGGGGQVADTAQSADTSGQQTAVATQAQPAQSIAYVAPSPNTVTAGTIIPAMLLSGINTDTPGQVIAQVMGDVYDNSGSSLLIPAGSRILGQMTGKVSGQTGRVGVTFSQIVMPDGGAWAIGDSLVAVDAEGYSGLEGTVHKHTGANFAAGLFNSALSALSTINVDRVTLDAGNLVNEMNSRAATTTIDPGYQFNVYVTNNITF